MNGDLTTIAHVESRDLATVLPSAVQMIDPAKHFLPVSWELIEQAAELVSTCPGLAPQFADPRNCRFIAYQAARWGMDPIAVANKTYFMPRKGGANAGLLVGYEAQLIMALINSDPSLTRALDFTYGYENPAQPMAALRYCNAFAYVKGDPEPRVVRSPTVARIKVKNSPLWFSDPDQQLAYYTGRSWGRRHRPGRILGVYEREELEAFRDAETGIHVVKLPLFEEDDPPQDLANAGPIPTTPGDIKNFERAEAKALGEKAEPGDDYQPPEGDGDSGPKDMPEIKAWAETERKRIIALDNVDTIAIQAEALVRDARFKRLIAYDQADAKRIDKSFRNRIEELKAG